MELASFPGGFDFVAAEKMGFSLILAQGLPGKHFPETAGRIIAETVLDLLDNA
jgi:dipicolinate synthase subunit A